MGRKEPTVLKMSLKDYLDVEGTCLDDYEIQHFTGSSGRGYNPAEDATETMQFWAKDKGFEVIVDVDYENASSKGTPGPYSDDGARHYVIVSGTALKLKKKSKRK